MFLIDSHMKPCIKRKARNISYKSFTYILLFISLHFLSNCQLALKFKNFNGEKHIEIANSLGIKLLKIPPGSFEIGCSNGDMDCDEDEKPQKEISITKAFYIGSTEITNRQFKEFIRQTGYITDAEKYHSINQWTNCHNSKDFLSLPVSCVSWNDAKAFTTWLSNVEKKVYRLPTEAEWEYAARADFFTRFYWGVEMDDSYAWYNKNSNSKPNPIKTKTPNSRGLYDISGNVWEWCEDYYDKDFYKNITNKNPFQKQKTKGKVLRGGSWFDPYLMLRITTREFAPPETIENHYGFRIVREE